MINKISMGLMLRFDAVLDPPVHRRALERVVARPGWDKLGGRVRRDQTTGRLQYHIPAVFTPECPAVDFSHAQHDMLLAEHPVAGRIPSATAEAGVLAPRIVCEPGEFVRPLVRSGESSDPPFLQDYLALDRPHMQLHVVSFRDATLVSLTWLHHSFDIMGLGSLIKAWELGLHGRNDEIPKPSWPVQDPLADVERTAAEYRPPGPLLKGPRLARWTLRAVWDVVRRRETSLAIVLPGQFLASLRAASEKWLAEQPAEERVLVPFLSDSDLASAWWVRTVTAARERARKRPPASSRRQSVLFLQPMSLRGRLAYDRLPDNRPYLGNAFVFVSTLLRAREIVTQPIAYTATTIRRSLTESTAPGVANAIVAAAQPAVDKGQLALYSDATTDLLIVSSWTKARLYSPDFSPACRGDGNRASEPIRPVSVWAEDSGPLPTRNGLRIQGIDFRGSVWLSGALREDLWKSVEAVMKEQASA
jgi:hypothetical protein